MITERAAELLLTYCTFPKESQASLKRRLLERSESREPVRVQQRGKEIDLIAVDSSEQRPEVTKWIATLSFSPEGLEIDSPLPREFNMRRVVVIRSIGEEESFLKLQYPGKVEVELERRFAKFASGRSLPLEYRKEEEEVTTLFYSSIEGTLRTRFQDPEPIDNKTCWKWTMQLLEMLVALEKAGVVHRNIRPETIIRKEGNLRLIGFVDAVRVGSSQPIPCPVRCSRYFNEGRRERYLPDFLWEKLSGEESATCLLSHLQPTEKLSIEHLNSLKRERPTVQELLERVESRFLLDSRSLEEARLQKTPEALAAFLDGKQGGDEALKPGANIFTRAELIRRLRERRVLPEQEIMTLDRPSPEFYREWNRPELDRVAVSCLLLLLWEKRIPECIDSCVVNLAQNQLSGKECLDQLQQELSSLRHTQRVSEEAALDWVLGEPIVAGEESLWCFSEKKGLYKEPIPVKNLQGIVREVHEAARAKKCAEGGSYTANDIYAVNRLFLDVLRPSDDSSTKTTHLFLEEEVWYVGGVRTPRDKKMRALTLKLTVNNLFVKWRTPSHGGHFKSLYKRVSWNGDPSEWFVPKVRQPNRREDLMSEFQVASLLYRKAPDLFVAVRCVREEKIKMQICEGGDLYTNLTKGSVTDAERRLWMLHLLRALQFLHKSDLIHCDVKPENIFIMGDRTARLGDFGLTLPAGTRCCPGTLGFVAPEICKKLTLSDPERYTQPALDIYSAGKTLLELLKKSEDPVLQGDVTTYVKKCMMQEDPAQRPSAQEAITALKTMLE